MPLYDMTVFERVDGAGLHARPALSQTFEAANNDAARVEGYRRSRGLPEGHSAALYRAADAGPSRTQLDVWDSPKG